MATAKKQTAKTKNSTLAIDAETSERLNLFCHKNGITKKDFIELALTYFENTGIDIHSNDVFTDMIEIKDKIDSILKIQVDSAVKLTGIQQKTALLSEVQENTTKLIESQELKGKKKWWKW